MPLANYTTKVPVVRSVALIQEMLARAGAKSVMLDFEALEPCAVSFCLIQDGMQIGYRLPCNWRGVLAAMRKDSRVTGSLKRDEQAKRVAWRTVHDWLRAQLAMVEVGSAALDQMMMSHAITLTGETLYERMKASRFELLALPAPGGSYSDDEQSAKNWTGQPA